MASDTRVMGVKSLLVKIDAPSESSEGSDGLTEGQFTGYASVFNNKDSYGDIVRPGAFLKSLGGYGEKGSGIPAYWSHRMDDPMMNIGKTVEAKEDDHGLFVKVQLDLDNPNGAQAHKLIKEGRVSQMSFAYTVKDYAWGESEAEGSYLELKELELHEVSLVPVGANQETELLAVKSVGRAASILRKADGDIATQVLELLREAVSMLEGDQEDSEKSGEESGDNETDGKSDEPTDAAKDDDLTESKSAVDDASNDVLGSLMLATVGINL